MVDVSVCPTEDELMEEIKKDLDKKDADDASKTFESVKAKFQKEKDKHLKMNVDLNEMINRLFEGNRSNVNDERTKLLKDLKLFVAVKSTKGDGPTPTTVAKLRERITLVRDREHSTLSTYLVYKGCTRDDVLSSLTALNE